MVFVKLFGVHVLMAYARPDIESVLECQEAPLRIGRGKRAKNWQIQEKNLVVCIGPFVVGYLLQIAKLLPLSRRI